MITTDDYWNRDLASFSASTFLPTMVCLQVGHSDTRGFLMQLSHTGCPLEHCHILVGGLISSGQGSIFFQCKLELEYEN